MSLFCFVGGCADMTITLLDDGHDGRYMTLSYDRI
jgi:hypothetical protein